MLPSDPRLCGGGQCTLEAQDVFLLVCAQTNHSARSTMTMQCPFAGLHETLTVRILSNESLSLKDKMHCEEVCTAWKTLLRCSRPDTSRGVWAKRLDLNLRSRGLKDISLKVGVEVPTVELQSGNPCLTTRQRAGLDWLSRRAAGISELRIDAPGNPKWTLAFVLLALQSTSPPGPNVQLYTGDLTAAFLQQHQQNTFNSSCLCHAVGQADKVYVCTALQGWSKYHIPQDAVNCLPT